MSEPLPPFIGDDSHLFVDGTSEIIRLFALTEPAPPDITIMGADNVLLVTIHPDGTLDYGPSYTPDEAARAFWDALRHLAPARCPACGHLGLEAP